MKGQNPQTAYDIDPNNNDGDEVNNPDWGIHGPNMVDKYLDPIGHTENISWETNESELPVIGSENERPDSSYYQNKVDKGLMESASGSR